MNSKILPLSVLKFKKRIKRVNTKTNYVVDVTFRAIDISEIYELKTKVYKQVS